MSACQTLLEQSPPNYLKEFFLSLHVDACLRTVRLTVSSPAAKLLILEDWLGVLDFNWLSYWTPREGQQTSRSARTK
jgi:hypothetical protein